MKSLKKLLVLSLVFMSIQIYAQDLDKHRWEDRLLLILVDDPSDELYIQQLKVFQAEAAGMQERKLVVYQITPKQCRTGYQPLGVWKNHDQLYQKRKQTDATFEIQLIGLDGGTKLTQTELLTTEKLFAIIDGMPMRRAEMRRELRGGDN